jgi:hypothetical protein
MMFESLEARRFLSVTLPDQANPVAAEATTTEGEVVAEEAQSGERGERISTLASGGQAGGGGVEE